MGCVLAYIPSLVGVASVWAAVLRKGYPRDAYRGYSLQNYVYRKRCAGVLPNINEYKHEMEPIRNIERYNAVKSGKRDKHMKKWYNVLDQVLANSNPIDYISDYVENLTV